MKERERYRQTGTESERRSELKAKVCLILMVLSAFIFQTKNFHQKYIKFFGVIPCSLFELSLTDNISTDWSDVFWTVTMHSVLRTTEIIKMINYIFTAQFQGRAHLMG